jgi:hypothetical protein
MQAHADAISALHNKADMSALIRQLEIQKLAQRVIEASQTNSLVLQNN